MLMQPYNRIVCNHQLRINSYIRKNETAKKNKTHDTISDKSKVPTSMNSMLTFVCGGHLFLNARLLSGID